MRMTKHYVKPSIIGTLPVAWGWDCGWCSKDNPLYRPSLCCSSCHEDEDMGCDRLPAVIIGDVELAACCSQKSYIEGDQI